MSAIRIKHVFSDDQQLSGTNMSFLFTVVRCAGAGETWGKSVTSAELNGVRLFRNDWCHVLGLVAVSMGLTGGALA